MTVIINAYKMFMIMLAALLAIIMILAFLYALAWIGGLAYLFFEDLYIQLKECRRNDQ
jgi:hypothetical protein